MTARATCDNDFEYCSKTTTAVVGKGGKEASKMQEKMRSSS